jgi:hypothetical protein
MGSVGHAAATCLEQQQLVLALDKVESLWHHIKLLGHPA